MKSYLPAATLAALALGACQRGAMGPCDRIVGNWRGVGVEATPGSDPDAVRVLSEVVRGERYRITRISPSSMQRERANEQYGRAPGDPLYIDREADGACYVTLRTRETQRRLTFAVGAGGNMTVRGESPWAVQVFQRSN